MMKVIKIHSPKLKQAASATYIYIYIYTCMNSAQRVLFTPLLFFFIFLYERYDTVCCQKTDDLTSTQAAAENFKDSMLRKFGQM